MGELADRLGVTVDRRPQRSPADLVAQAQRGAREAKWEPLVLHGRGGASTRSSLVLYPGGMRLSMLAMQVLTGKIASNNDRVSVRFEVLRSAGMVAIVRCDRGGPNSYALTKGFTGAPKLSTALVSLGFKQKLHYPVRCAGPGRLEVSWRDPKPQ